MTSPARIRDVYGGDNVLFRVLCAMGWGDLINLGYYRGVTLPALASGLAPFQKRLVSRSVGLLRLTPGDRVLDAACGRGYSTHLIARQGRTATGVDLLDEHVAEARRRFGKNPAVRYLAGDVTAMGPESRSAAFGDAAFTKVHCLEAAFHLGPEGRRAFLEETYRILAPGGRLVLVDFLWRTASPSDINSADPGRLVRDTWGFTEFESARGYRRHCREVGYALRGTRDWSRPVTDRFMQLGIACARLALTRSGRGLLERRWPGLAGLSHRDWLRFAAVVHAHDTVRRACGYGALILDKPGEPRRG